MRTQAWSAVQDRSERSDTVTTLSAGTPTATSPAASTARRETDAIQGISSGVTAASPITIQKKYSAV